MDTPTQRARQSTLARIVINIEKAQHQMMHLQGEFEEILEGTDPLLLDIYNKWLELQDLQKKVQYQTSKNHQYRKNTEEIARNGLHRLTAIE